VRRRDRPGDPVRPFYPPGRTVLAELRSQFWGGRRRYGRTEHPGSQELGTRAGPLSAMPGRSRDRTRHWGDALRVIPAADSSQTRREPAPGRAACTVRFPLAGTSCPVLCQQIYQPAPPRSPAVRRRACIVRAAGFPAPRMRSGIYKTGSVSAGQWRRIGDLNPGRCHHLTALAVRPLRSRPFLAVTGPARCPARLLPAVPGCYRGILVLPCVLCACRLPGDSCRPEFGDMY
jgi:hypothetical protein